MIDHTPIAVSVRFVEQAAPYATECINEDQTFQIVLPLSLPVLVTVFILDVVATWNELLMALTIINSDQSKTLPLGILNFSGQFTTNYNGLAAAILIGILPILIAYALLQRYIVSGLTAGAVKG